MRALVTGGAGFVGTNLIKRLLKDEYEVVSFDNYSTGFKDNRQKGCTYFDVDITEKFDDWKEEFDVIFHLAALARIQPSIKNPSETIKNNFDGTLNVLEYARKKNTTVIYAGSSSKHHGLYGSPYAWSKYGGEELCKLYSEIYGLNTTICRFYNVYGSYHIRNGTYATVIGIFENQYLNNKPLTIVGDGKQKRDFTHIDDIINGCYLAMIKGKQNEYMLCTNKTYSILQIAKMFKTKFKFLKSRPGERFGSTILNNNAKKILGFEAKKNIKSYIKNFISVN